MYDLNVGDVLGNTWVGFPPFSHQRSLNLTNKPKRVLSLRAKEFLKITTHTLHNFQNCYHTVFFKPDL